MGDKRFPEIDEETGEAMDDGSPPIPKTGVAAFDQLSEPEKSVVCNRLTTSRWQV